MAKPVLTVTNLSKTYDRYQAVKSISFQLNEGEILGLLGPNGAGKTTTIQMLLGLTTPTSGSINYFGRELTTHPEYCLSRINFASAYAQMQGKMTVRQNLRIFAGLYGVKNPTQKIQELSQIFEIEPFLDEVFWHLSSGQQTRAILAKSLINDPKIILMDEPTASLDPDIVNKIIDLIGSLKKKQGVSILFTSHNMQEVTRVCDRVMFLHQGEIHITDTPVNLTKIIGSSRLTITFSTDKVPVKDYLTQMDYPHRFIRSQIAEIEIEEKLIPSILFDLHKQKVWISDIDIKRPTLEDVFLSFAKKSLSGNNS